MADERRGRGDQGPPESDLTHRYARKKCRQKPPDHEEQGRGKANWPISGSYRNKSDGCGDYHRIKDKRDANEKNVKLNIQFRPHINRESADSTRKKEKKMKKRSGRTRLDVSRRSS